MTLICFFCLGSFLGYVFEAAAFSEGMCSICLDDGYASQFANARGYLNSYNLKGVFSIISDKMESGDSYFMNASQVQILASEGHEIASHSKSHPFLTALNEQELENELALSRESILNNVGVSPYSFAAPYGDYNDYTISKVKNYYENHRTIEEGYNDSYTDPYRLKVRSVFDRTSVAEIQGWIDAAILEKKWLILLFHQIDNNPGEYHYQPVNFGTICAYIANSNIANVTVREGSLKLASTKPDFGGRQIVGYYPDWAPDFVNKIDYAKLTHINYFSIEPFANGDLNTTHINPTQLTQVVQAAHCAGPTVSITVGGWGRCSGFYTMASDPSARSNFIQKIADFINQYNLDGVDLNWEPIYNEVDRQNYSTLIEEMRAGLGSEKLLSVAVSTWYYEITDWAVDDIDWLEVMAYDMNWPSAEHANFEDTIAAMNFWEALPVPKSKLLMGLPFYGKNETGDAQTYSWIVDTYNPLASEDWAGGYYFNGIDTIKTKTAYVYDNGYGGVMIWNIAQDKQDDRSLLGAIASCASEYTPPTPNPMTWLVAPYAVNNSSISMTATTAVDVDGVEYYFACTSAQPGGSDSGWQDSATYTDTGLQPGTTYSYKVNARDKSVHQNETAWSVIASSSTPAIVATIYVGDITLSVVPGTKGRYFGKAVVTIKNNLGGVVSGADVTGTFSGSFSKVATITTDASGKAVFVTTTQNKRTSFSFTVNNVTHATLTYKPQDNVETSDKY